MKKLSKIILSSIFAGLPLLLPVSSYAHLPSAVEGKTIPSLAPMLNKTTPSVVNIAVEKLIPQTPNPLQPEMDQNTAPTKVLGVGSGVIIDAKKGYIVTNAHVVKDQKIMVVTLKDGRRYRAKVIGKDEGFDLAVIQIHANHLTALPIGNSDQLKVGDFVVAVGSPFGLTQTVTSGVISALNRQEPRIDNFQSFIQTDAPINPGNSGGALIDLEGKLIGINTAIVTPSAGNIGIGFAIPSDMVKSVAEQLIKYGKVERGMLGVTAQNITPELADALNLKHNKGALVTKVVAESPAAKAGVEVQDIIESVNGIRIHSSAQLHNMLGLVRPGTKIELTVLRDHKVLPIKTEVADPKKVLLQRELPFLGGMRMQKFNDLEPDGTILQGVLVTGVDDSSDGALGGLEPGDIIISANGQLTPTVDELMKIAEGKPKELLLKVARGAGQLFLVIQQSQ
ncbi:Do family serine endopeptidase [Coxiella burnetii]|uniref:Endopeptidase n=1 Tax=Coxiella burnetii (strain RSA 493 / Nine Mile phase I) TaxID=227377 RepID=Q83DH6_COXBU|nr:Do family serine endopeptidase [Coxiella burnetii]NP_819781.1 endopeptidase [Coxiella burnetii RSA 493]AAO90295.1 endopeptidase [Coxiella burnetii RSA 493]ABX78913.1 protease Do [Coxiella burnetii RSA 331]ACJ19882.1 endopeptidase [Coxiella burnetii CbuK_Q154]AIT62896.1 Protease Do [Coxiella burnetii str. Namibia]AML49343.1 endopeptidase [Coxiella burnetii]